MFKRVERKMMKKQREEELGIDEDMKEVLGIQDTDSDESSESESGSESSGSLGGEEGVEAVDYLVGDGRSVRTSGGEDTDDDDKEEALMEKPLQKKRKRTGLEYVGELEEQGSAEESGEEAEEEEEGIQMSIEEALHDPLHVVSIQPDIRACILCPGKLLKNSQMAEVHILSQAHQRRFSRFQQLANDANPEDNAQDVLHQKGLVQQLKSPPGHPSSGKLSKRATKRVAKFEQIKKKRQKQKAAKEKAIAKKAKGVTTLPAPTNSDELEEQPRKKKQKVEPSVRDRPKQHLPSKSRKDLLYEESRSSSTAKTLPKSISKKLHKKKLTRNKTLPMRG